MLTTLLDGNHDTANDFDGTMSTSVPGDAGNWDNMMWGGTGWLWPSLMMLFWVAVIGLGIWAVIRVTRNNRVEPPVAPGPESAMQVLDRRLASGELDSKEYDRIRSQIRHVDNS